MNYSRRTDERRRRVMMSTGTTATAAPTASSRKRIEELREARRPSMAYGSRVRRCLRGRWFSLVPVSRAAYVKTLAVLAMLALVLILLHDASVRYASIAEQSTWVEVLRINRYGSLGRYVIGLLYLATAGSAWLVYQLRRYRNDDFSGNYQLWQWIVCTTLVASFASTVPLVEMSGVAIEWTLGKRVALSGEDWIELFLMVGGAILALRIVAEMWRYRVAASLMLVGWLAMAIPIASEWNLLAVEDLNRWTIVTSAPLIAAILWFASTVGYLRCLFREVRGIEPAAGYVQRLRLAAEDWTATASSAISPRSEADETITATPTTTPAVAKPRPAVAKPSPKKVTTEAPSIRSEKSNRKGWWPFRRKPDVSAPDLETETQNQAKAAQPVRNVSPNDVTADTHKNDAGVDETEAAPPKRGWWPSRKRKSTEDPDETSVDLAESAEVVATNDDEPEGDSEPIKKRSFGLGSLMKRRKPTAVEESMKDSDANSLNDAGDDDQDDDDVDESDETSDDDIDWSSMNKAERRRMRKQLKRGKAA